MIPFISFKYRKEEIGKEIINSVTHIIESEKYVLGENTSKFEKNYGVNGAQKITYQLINAFPKNLTTTPLQYGEAEIMKVTVSMNYDRYRIYRDQGQSIVGGAVLNSDGTYTVEIIQDGGVVSKTVSAEEYASQYQSN